MSVPGPVDPATGRPDGTGRTPFPGNVIPAERMAELLNGLVLDEQREVLGRQRIGQIREDLRAYDRQREAPPLSKPTRW